MKHTDTLDFAAVAAREVRAARQIGTFANKWGDGERAKVRAAMGNAAKAQARPRNRGIEVLRLIAKGVTTTPAIREAMRLDKSATLLRDAVNRGEAARIGRAEYALTDAGRALLAKEAANG